MSRPLLPGYKMRRLVHRGRSFDVHDAWSFERSCPVVVKVARPSAGPEAKRRLMLEGRLLTTLAHPHLVAAYEVHNSPRAALVLETLPGRTLGVLFARLGPMSVRDVAEMGRQLGSVVGYLHRAGYVHCDLKPENAVVEAGRLKLIDMSLATRPGPYRSNNGTPGYLAPEQAARGEVGPATDVWGLGLLMLEAVTGDDPFPVDCPEYDDDLGPLAAPPRVRDRRRVPRAFGDLLDACTAFDAGQRPTVGEVIAVLNTFADRPKDISGAAVASRS